MLETNGIPFLTYAVQLILFFLFLIKAWGLLQDYILPRLREYKQHVYEKWMHLQEEHLLLVSQKKQLATQFLQQEKQIALLTAKLESWHLICYHKEKERENILNDRARLMNERAAVQQHVTAQIRLASQAGQDLVAMVAESVERDAHVLFDQYLVRAVEKLSVIEKKDTVYESSYAKKTEGA
ncbi:MAG: hypothetical protein WCJ17_01395 [bacterium]|jgi:hypothetical protein